MHCNSNVAHHTPRPTHAVKQVQYLKDCDQIVILDHGRVKAAGSYRALSTSGFDIESFVKQMEGEGEGGRAEAAEGEGDGGDGGENKAVANPNPNPNPNRRGDGGENKAVAEAGRPRSKSGLRGSQGGAAKGSAKGAKEGPVAEPRAAGKPGPGLMTTEKRDRGSVRWKTYWYYISRGHPIIYLLMMLVVLGSQALLVYSNIWLAQWGTASYAPLSDERNFYYLGRFSIFVVMGSFATFINMNLNLEHRTKAAKVTR